MYLLARLLARDADPLNALGAAALTLLVWSPRSLFDASLQMTVLAIVAIAGIAGAARPTHVFALRPGDACTSFVCGVECSRLTRRSFG